MRQYDLSYFKDCFVKNLMVIFKFKRRIFRTRMA